MRNIYSPYQACRRGLLPRMYSRADVRLEFLKLQTIKANRLKSEFNQYRGNFFKIVKTTIFNIEFISGQYNQQMLESA